jgi:hypothetical protein
LVVVVTALGVGTTIYTKDLSRFDIVRVMGLKMSIPRLHPVSQETPGVQEPNSAVKITEIENEPKSSLVPILPKNCVFQESELTHY